MYIFISIVYFHTAKQCAHIVSVTMFTWNHLGIYSKQIKGWVGINLLSIQIHGKNNNVRKIHQFANHSVSDKNCKEICVLILQETP